MATLSEEEENYVRMSLLMTGVSPRAVRCKFDKEFAPAVLSTTIRKEYKSISDLYKKRVINQAQWNVLHPRNGTPDSKNFDVTLMICLLRNLTTMTPPSVGYDRLPPSGEKTEGADLARIKYYRNYLAHSDDTKMESPYFTSAWTDVADALGRLGGQSMLQECKDLKVKILDQSNKEIILEIKYCKDEIIELKQALEGAQEKMRTELESQKKDHKNFKVSYESDQTEKSKEIADLTKSYVSFKTDQEEKAKEVHNLAKSYTSLKIDHEEKTKEVKTLALSYVDLKTDNDENRKQIKKIKAVQDDPVPLNIRGQINRKLEMWKKDNNMFVETRAAKHVLECVKTKSCVTVTGSSGMGKTFTVRHVALQMAEIGFDIVPVINPEDIEKYYNPKTKSLFVIDNFCGMYTLNQTVFDKYKSLSDTISDILGDRMTKIIVSCRLQVYQDDLFKTLTLFKSCECNLMSKEICLLPREKQSLAELYLKTDASKISQYVNLYDCFPLLCKLYRENPNFDVTDFFKNPFSVYEAEITQLWTEGAYGKYCALALCVIFNNHLKEKWLTENIDKNMKTVIKNTCEACKLERGSSMLVIRDQLESVTNTFIRMDTGNGLEKALYHSDTDDEDTDELGRQSNKFVQEDAIMDRKDFDDKHNLHNYYCTIHDKLFDYLVSYFGKVMIRCLIENADSRLIAERFLFDGQDCDDEFTIIVPNKYKQMYLERIIGDWSIGHVSQVFSNTNMKIQKFRDIFLKYVKELDIFLQNTLVKMCDMSYNTRDKSYCRYEGGNCSSTTPLMHCCLVGDINLVQWFCDHGIDVNHCNSEGESPLYMACKIGHCKIVHALVENKADVSKCTSKNESLLYIACKGGQFDIVTKLLDNQANINQCTDDGCSPLYIASKKGHTKVVCQLLENNANISKCTKLGESSLHIACVGGYTDIVSALLEKTANFNKCTDWGESPLYVACRGGYIDVVIKLLAKKAEINKCAWRGESPLYIACGRGYHDIVTRLLDNKADINKCIDNGRSPLYIACKRGYTDVVTTLLNNKANINKSIKWGESPLYIACKKGYTHLVTKLLDNKADVNTCTNCDRSPLYIACRGGYDDIVCKLLDKKADINKCTKFGESPLYTACSRGYTEVAAKLLDNNADFNQRPEWGKSPLYIACKEGYTELLTTLLNHNADINQFTKLGESILFIACEAGHTAVVTTLLEHNADINKCTEWGGSPLYIACKGGYTDIVITLLNNKADINKCTEWGGSPLHVSCKGGYTEIVSYLLDNQADVCKRTRRGESPLYIACKGGYTAIVSSLFGNKADSNQCTVEGKSPLYIASECGHNEVVSKLLENKADINKCTNGGLSPLYTACNVWSGRLKNNLVCANRRKEDENELDNAVGREKTIDQYKDTIKLLMNAGADYKLCTNEGQSLLYLFDSQDIIDMILSWGNNDPSV